MTDFENANGGHHSEPVHPDRLALLEYSEQRYRSVVEHLGEGMFVTQDSRIVFANQQASHIMRVPTAELLGADPVQWIHPEDQPIVTDLRAQLAQQQVVQDHYELRHIAPDGEVRWFSIRPKSVPWEGGHATLTFLADITERRVMMGALHRSEERYRAMVEHTGEGLLVVQDGRFVFVNDRAAQLVHMTKDDLLREGYLHMIHPDDRALVDARRRKRLAGEEVPSRYEIRIIWPTGEVRWLDLGVTIVPWDGAMATLTFCSDITERIQAEQEMRATQEQQRELNALRSRFVAMTSHEFRTPLATILSSAELLTHYGERMPPAEKASVLQTIEGSVHRMTRMLDRVLLLGQVDAHMLEFHPQMLDLYALCQSVVHDACTQHADSPCQIELQVDPAVQTGRYDEKLLRHIFSNLLSNALKYSPQGGNVVLAVRESDGRTVFEVTDSGIGIPTDEISHLFESFHRASNVGNIQGTGLGLAIVKNSVARHGGDIAVRSEIGRGTTFVVTI